MGAQVVAEGIEGAAQLEALRELGVPLGQGFFLGRPTELPQAGTELRSAMAWSRANAPAPGPRGLLRTAPPPT